jgi:hypothetical protein
MLQNDDARLLSGNRIPDLFLPELRLWSYSWRPGYFSRDETELFRIVALAYADASRPSMAYVYRILCALIEEDAASETVRIRKPSLTTFRRIVKSLPQEYVHYMRSGGLRKMHTFEFVARGARVLAINFH